MDRNKHPDSLPEKDNDCNDEEIIDLTQVFENGEEDDIINLDDVLEPPAKVSETPEEGEIPLLDVVPTDESYQPFEKQEDGVIELTDLTQVAELDPSEPSGERHEPAVDETDEVSFSETLTVSEKQLENALVRVIEKIYGEKIEQLLIQTIEKTIKQEIDEIRQALIDENE